MIGRLTTGITDEKVRELIRDGRRTLDAVERQDASLYQLGKATKQAVNELRIYERVGTEARKAGDHAKTQDTLNRLVNRFIQVRDRKSTA